MLSNLRNKYEAEMYPIKKYAAKDECVYLLYNYTTKLTKIGITSNMTERHRSLERQGGIELSMIGLCEIEKNEHEEAIIVEKYLHNHFKNQRKEGEWFNLRFRDHAEIINLFYLISD